MSENQQASKIIKILFSMRSPQPHIKAKGLREFKALPADQQQDAKAFLTLFAQAADDVRSGKAEDVFSVMKQRIAKTEEQVGADLKRILELD